MEVKAGLFPEELFKVQEYMLSNLMFKQLAMGVKFPNSALWALPLPWLDWVPSYVEENSNEVVYGPDYSPPPGERVEELCPGLLPCDIKGQILPSKVGGKIKPSINCFHDNNKPWVFFGTYVKGYGGRGAPPFLI